MLARVPGRSRLLSVNPAIIIWKRTPHVVKTGEPLLLFPCYDGHETLYLDFDNYTPS
jgi:hypothetical protein